MEGQHQNSISPQTQFAGGGGGGRGWEGVIITRPVTGTG